MTPLTPLPPADLHLACDPAGFDFDTTDQLADLEHMLGQDRAVEAIELGAGLDLEGFNLFVIGPPGTGRHSFIRQFLGAEAGDRATPSDWCYVNNFREPRHPRAIELPAGCGRAFRDDVHRLVEEARSAIPEAFESEDYHNRRQAIEEEAGAAQERAFREVRAHAKARGVGIVQTATGFNFVPLEDGEPIAPDAFQELPEAEKDRFRTAIDELGQELRRMLRAIPPRARKVRERIRELDREVALFAVGGLIEELLESYTGFPAAVAHLHALHQDMADHARLFRPLQDNEEAGPGEAGGPEQVMDREVTVTRRYAVNLLVDHTDASGAPVLLEDHPTYPALMGRVEHAAKLGTLVTDFTLIRSGALHRANGGFLVVDAGKILTRPFAWDGLKRALKAGVIDIRSPAEEFSLVSTVSLEPEPIPLRLKVVIIGDRLLYHLLETYDPEVAELFKVAADFEDDMARDEHNVQGYARLMATLARREGLKPVDRRGVARLVEEGARHAADAARLTTHVRRMADILREAHHWAERGGQGTIGTAEVERAVEGRRHRMGRIPDHLRRETLQGTLLIDTAGATVGQVNGLAAMELGDELFAHPMRISARLSAGSGKVVDIEREVELGGPIHSKGVLILANFLAAHYVTDRPLSLTASLVFEQSYGPVEGDSASAAELCALLSALAEAPVTQSLAITGSVNQYGRVQAIGAVNEKIEGFFDLCAARGLSGDQGVIIPAANTRHLMLRRRVVEAAAAGRFRVHAVDTIDDCMTLLTGIDAGRRDRRGQFARGSINHRVTERLLKFADRRRRFARGKVKTTDED